MHIGSREVHLTEDPHRVSFFHETLFPAVIIKVVPIRMIKGDRMHVVILHMNKEIENSWMQPKHFGKYPSA